MTEMTVSMRKPPGTVPPAMAPQGLVGPGFQIVVPPHLAGDFGLPQTKATRVIRCRRTATAS